MSGLRVLMAPCQDGLRGASSIQEHGLDSPLGSSECLARLIDRSHHLIRLQPDRSWLKLGEERQHLVAPQLAAKHHLLGAVHPVQLEELLRRVDENARNLVHGRLPSIEVLTTSIRHIDAVRGPSTPS
jgi:hypothetical protein